MRPSPLATQSPHECRPTRSCSYSVDIPLRETSEVGLSTSTAGLHSLGCDSWLSRDAWAEGPVARQLLGVASPSLSATGRIGPTSDSVSRSVAASDSTSEGAICPSSTGASMRLTPLLAPPAAPRRGRTHRSSDCCPGRSPSAPWRRRRAAVLPTRARGRTHARPQCAQAHCPPPRANGARARPPVRPTHCARRAPPPP